MSKMFVETVTGRNKLSTYYLFIYMFFIPVAFFTNYLLLNGIAWIMTMIQGFLIFTAGVITHQEAKDSYNWPKVKVHNLKCSLNFTLNDNVKSYIPEIKCKFNVDGKEYEGAEYDFSASYTSKDIASEKIKSVKNMNPLMVYYKPSDPAVNVINPGIYSVHYVRFILGAMMVVMPILICFDIVVLK